MSAPLWQAALEAQTQRVLDTAPLDLPRDGAQRLGFTACLGCGAPLGRGPQGGRPNKSGWCRACKLLRRHA